MIKTSLIGSPQLLIQKPMAPLGSAATMPVCHMKPHGEATPKAPWGRMNGSHIIMTVHTGRQHADDPCGPRCRLGPPRACCALRLPRSGASMSRPGHDWWWC